MKVFGLILLLSVAYAQELDTHGDPFAKPPYSWTELDVHSYKVEPNSWYKNSNQIGNILKWLI